MATTTPATPVATVRVPEDLRAQLAELARRNERSLAGEARLAMREHLERAAADAAASGDRVFGLDR